MEKLILNEAPETNLMQQYRDANEETKDIIINDFIDSLNLIGLTQSLREAIINHAKEIGSAFLDPLGNPFVQFLKNYQKFNGSLASFTGEDYGMLIRLYGDRVINDTNLRASSFVGKEDIIFVNDVYVNKYENFKYICQAYYWLKNKANINNLNFENPNFNNDYISNFCKELGISIDSLKRDSKGQFVSVINNLKTNAANIIIFVNGEFKYNGKVREAEKIYNALSYLDNIKSELGVEETVNKDVEEIKLLKLDSNKWKDRGFTKENINRQDALELIKLLVNMYGLKLW